MDAKATQKDNLDVNEDGNKSAPVEIVESNVGDKDIEQEETPVTNEEPSDPRRAIAEKFEKENRNYVAEPEEEALPEKEVTPGEPEMVTVKVNGKTSEVEKSKIDNAGGVENYQKLLAANEGLREVAENRKMLEEHAAFLREQERQIALREQQLSQKDVAPAGDLPKKGDHHKDFAEKARAYREALLDGEEEKADELLSELFSTAQPATVIDTGAIVEAASNHTLRKIGEQTQQAELVSALNQFTADYPDIKNDSRLYQLADMETNVIRRENPDWTSKQIMYEAGERVRSWYGKQAQENSKLEEKRQLSTPRAGNVRAQPRPSPKQETNADYIRNLRKARGLE